MRHFSVYTNWVLGKDWCTSFKFWEMSKCIEKDLVLSTINLHSFVITSPQQNSSVKTQGSLTVDHRETWGCQPRRGESATPWRLGGRTCKIRLYVGTKTLTAPPFYCKTRPMRCSALCIQHSLSWRWSPGPVDTVLLSTLLECWRHAQMPARWRTWCWSAAGTLPTRWQGGFYSWSSSTPDDHAQWGPAPAWCKESTLCSVIAHGNRTSAVLQSQTCRAAQRCCAELCWFGGGGECTPACLVSQRHCLPLLHCCWCGQSQYGGRAKVAQSPAAQSDTPPQASAKMGTCWHDAPRKKQWCPHSQAYGTQPHSESLPGSSSCLTLSCCCFSTSWGAQEFLAQERRTDFEHIPSGSAGSAVVDPVTENAQVMAVLTHGLHGIGMAVLWHRMHGITMAILQHGIHGIVMAVLSHGMHGIVMAALCYGKHGIGMAVLSYGMHGTGMAVLSHRMLGVAMAVFWHGMHGIVMAVSSHGIHGIGMTVLSHGILGIVMAVFWHGMYGIVMAVSSHGIHGIGMAVLSHRMLGIVTAVLSQEMVGIVMAVLSYRIHGTVRAILSHGMLGAVMTVLSHEMHGLLTVGLSYRMNGILWQSCHTEQME